MRVFVTGATGFIGEAVVKELCGAGHRVVGLARSDAGAAALRAAGVEVHRGDLTQPETLAAGARDADAVVHLAFNHDFSKFAENGQVERVAIAALGDALVSTGGALVVTSGTGMVSAPTPRPVTEDDEPLGGAQFPRSPERVAQPYADRGVRVAIVRLPQVHDPHKAGLVSFVIARARELGYVAHVGDGATCWPAAHVRDVARLYRLALERNAPFARYHAVAEEGVSLRSIAEVVGAGLNLPVRSITADESAAYFGWMSHLAQRDLRASSEHTRRTLAWEPAGPSLLDDLRTFAWV